MINEAPANPEQRIALQLSRSAVLDRLSLARRLQTWPVWSVLFCSVSALVTDTGGVLFHSAVIAREYGIPAVAAKGSATSHLTDGQFVTVDGTRAVIEVE